MTAERVKVEIRFGGACDPFHKQLDVVPSVVYEEQKLADALTLLSANNILAPSAIKTGRKRVALRIEKKLSDKLE